MPRYRKRPVVIDAVQWNKPGPDGRPRLASECKDHPNVWPTNYLEVAQGLGTSGCSREAPHWDWSVMGTIDTLEGRMFVSPGDWIVTGVIGEVYPVKPDIFKKTYELEEEA